MKILSHNDDLHRYKEQPGEFLSNIIRDIVDDLDGPDAPDFEVIRQKYFQKYKTRGSTYTSILCTSPIIEMLIHLWKFNDYYCSTNIFMPVWLRRNIIGEIGGVSGTVCTTSQLLILLF